MTTIAYRDGVMAADSLRTANGLRDGTNRKVWRKNGVPIGACGSTALCYRFREWVLAGMEGPNPFEGKGDGNGLVASPDGQVVCWGDHGAWLVDTEFYALGSGYQVAMGAMEAGADARRAVEIAAKHDCHTGGAIVALAHK